ncbi:MAG: FolC bifunctional protein [Peptococcaceae bacterium]|jgi:dihydrofolate synthase/folylpolyglutamate synthase|nr:FolC bifunctional protein [Peptococcaceae bacterium]
MEYARALETIANLTKFGINLGLSRITKLLALLGNPHESIPVIHIGGTNGKGSTTAILAAVLKEAGYKVGTYTSPHLISYTERYMINGHPIPEEEFARLVSEVVPLSEQVYASTSEYPTEFEVLTALAFLYFYREKVDILLLEVGLGGDIDSTNVVSSPLLSIITNVTLDHQDYLGPTPREIAVRKGGIIKKNRPVITAAQDEEVLDVLRSIAQEKGAPFHEVCKEVQWAKLSEDEIGQTFRVQTREQNYGELYLPLQGDHQLVNGATAVLALEILQSQGWNITREKIKKGFAAAAWPGRLEIMGRDPLVVIDGAHNAAGIEALARWLRKKRARHLRVILIIGMLADKDRLGAANLLAPLVDKVIITKPLSPRAGNWQELGTYFQKETGDVSVIEDLKGALNQGLKEAGENDLVLITGSLYLIGEVRKILLHG